VVGFGVVTRIGGHLAPRWLVVTVIVRREPVPSL
jgi:hypothetical protein